MLDFKITNNIDNAISKTSDENSYKRVNHHFSSFFEFFIISCREYHLYPSPCDAYDSEDARYTDSVLDYARDDRHYPTSGLDEFRAHIDIFYYIFWLSNESKGRYRQKCENERKKFHRKLEWSRQKRRYNIDKNVWKECDDDSNKVPFDDSFGLTCLLTITSGKDIVVSSNDKGYSSNQRKNKQKDRSNHIEKKSRSTLSTVLRGIIGMVFSYWIHFLERNGKFRTRNVVISEKKICWEERNTGTYEDRDGEKNWLHTMILP